MPIFKGVVENNQDPEKRFRVQVRLMGIHTGDKNKFPTENLPWCEVAGSTLFGNIGGVGGSSVLHNGTWVIVQFDESDLLYKEHGVVLGTVSGNY